jgi:hypothetical protein
MAYTNSKAVFSLDRFVVDILEFNKDFFNKDSPILMPAKPGADEQAKIPGIKGLAAVYKQFEFDPRKRMVVAGHTDTGDIEKHYDLAALRAESIVCLLQGTKNRWVEISHANQKIEDYQRILFYFHKTRAWACDPVNIDNNWDDDKTHKAIIEFVKGYNKKHDTNLLPTTEDEIKKLADDIKDDKAEDKKHRWPKKLWETVFELYIEEICAALKIKAKPPAKLPDATKIPRAGLKFITGTNSKKFVACGESFPLDALADDAEKGKNKYHYAKERKVDILFYYDKEGPWTNKGCKKPCTPKSGNKHVANNCPIWRKNYFLTNYLDPAKELEAVAYHLQFKYFNQIILDANKPKVLNVPGGLEIKAYHYKTPRNKATKEEIKAVTEFHDGIYTVKVHDDDTRKNIHFEFDAKITGTPAKSKWIYTKDNTSTPLIKEEKDDDIKKLLPPEKLPDRMKYYDLPKEWSSQNYWTKYNDGTEKTERFETVLKDKLKIKPYPPKEKTTTVDKPLIFSLDDIVLMDKDGKQKLKDRKFTYNAGTKRYTDAPEALSDKSRISLLYVKEKELVLYEPKDAKAPYHSKMKFKENLVTDYPPETRMIIFANNFYSVSTQRVGQKAGTFDPFVAGKQIKGCRAAAIKDPDYHCGLTVNANSTVAPYLYHADGVGNYELHYIHNGCPIAEVGDPHKVKVRSFMIIYWNGHFVKKAGVSAGELKKYYQDALLNSRDRWQNKGYLLEPFKLGTGDLGKVQIKPVFFFEAKLDRLGGKPKCRVSITNNASHGSMGVSTSKMYKLDFESRNVYTASTYNDIDGKGYKTIVVAHEIGHAMGLDDDYSYDDGDIDAAYYKTDDGLYSQYYLGMPYSLSVAAPPIFDSIMNETMAPRMKHIWLHINRLNVAMADANELKDLFEEAKFKIVHRYGAPVSSLNYYLKNDPAVGTTPAKDYRNILSPFKSGVLGPYIGGAPLVPGKPGDPTAVPVKPPIPPKPAIDGKGKLTLALYKLGEDEVARQIKISGNTPAWAFDGILPVFIKVGLDFKNYKAADVDLTKRRIWDYTGPPNPPPVAPTKDDWKDDLKKEITRLNNKFYLESTDANQDFRRTYIFFFPVIVDCAAMSNPAQARSKAHYTVEATYNDTDKIESRVASPTALKAGNKVNKRWLANYFLGRDPKRGVAVNIPAPVGGGTSITKDDLKFIRKWIRDELGDNTFTVKDAV